MLTLSVAVASYLIANAIPFFQDLVALIGALTSVPLTLTIPVLLHHKMEGVSLWQCCRPTRRTLASFGVLVFSGIFLVGSLTGTLYSIDLSWKQSKALPFACEL